MTDLTDMKETKTDMKETLTDMTGTKTEKNMRCGREKDFTIFPSEKWQPILRLLSFVKD